VLSFSKEKDKKKKEKGHTRNSVVMLEGTMKNSCKSVGREEKKKRHKSTGGERTG
jgi:hypothetical protein